jgi:hypothetical protein
MPWLSDPIKRAREIKGAWRAVGGVASAQALTLTARGNVDRTARGSADRTARGSVDRTARGSVDRTARGSVDRSVSERGAHASIPKMGVCIPGTYEPTGRDSVSVLTRDGNPLPDIR